MKSLAPLLSFIIAGSALVAQVPQHISYQGRVSVNGVNFHGTGEFKFALVDSGTNLSQTATATGIATAIVSVNLISGGSGYATPPVVTIAPPDDPEGVQATATATIDGGVVTQINVTNPGSGYFTNPVQVIIAPPPENIEHQVYWSNAGDLAPGEVPDTSVSLPVDKGLYSARLGDTAVANMAAFNPDIFYNPLFLRVWFNDGINGFQQLTPDQQLASAPYAMQARLAETVPPGSITSAKLAAGAAAANLNATGQSGVAQDGVVLSSTDSPSLVSAGFVRAGTLPVGGTWDIHPISPLAPRYRHSAVWTGTEMIVWGGSTFSPTPYGDGARYDPRTRQWTALPPGGGIRSSHHAVWTGTEMIVWGGFGDGGGSLNSGARYNLTSDSWSATSTVGAPSGGRAVVWTGNEMIILGDTPAGDARYSPATDSWAPISGAGSPLARTGFSSVWTGSEVIVFGGYVSDFNSPVNTGAKYNPTTNAWTPIAPAVSASQSRPAVWTGTQMIVAGNGAGEVYTPASNTWKFYSLISCPTVSSSAVWTGSELMVLNDADEQLSSYNPPFDTWRTIMPDIGIGGDCSIIWTGSEILLFGGEIGGSHLNRLLSYHPPKNFIMYRRP